jgi:CTD kinase subunit beta
MAPLRNDTAIRGRDPPPPPDPVGPHPSFIQVAKPYLFEQIIQECLTATGVSQLREDNIRLQGVTWIDNVRKALHLYEPRWRIYDLILIKN